MGSALLPFLLVGVFGPVALGGQEFVRRAGDPPDDERIRNFLELFKRRTRNIERLELATGVDSGGTASEVMVECGRVKTDSEDFAAVAELGAGEVLAHKTAAATRLRTETPLRFGDTEIAIGIGIGNVAPGYPGLYSLWLKKGEDGQWRLVFNNEADTWGTMYNSFEDVAEVPVEHSVVGEDEEELHVYLRPAEVPGESATLVLRWGPHAWTTPFSRASPTAAPTPDP